MPLTIGQKAPDFSLFNSDKEKVTLSNYIGKNVLLLFFPQSFTGVCTKELCSVRDSISAYNHANVEVFGISVDSVFTLAKYKEEQQLNFALLSDFNKEVCTAYDSIYKEWILDMNGVAKRSAFIIDKEGVLQYVEVLESAGDIPNFEAIQQTIATLN